MCISTAGGIIMFRESVIWGWGFFFLKYGLLCVSCNTQVTNFLVLLAKHIWIIFVMFDSVWMGKFHCHILQIWTRYWSVLFWLNLSSGLDCLDDYWEHRCLKSWILVEPKLPSSWANGTVDVEEGRNLCSLVRLPRIPQVLLQGLTKYESPQKNIMRSCMEVR